MFLEEEERKLVEDTRILINRQSFKNARKVWEQTREIYNQLKREQQQALQIINELEKELLELETKMRELDKKMYEDGTNLKQIEQYQFKLELLKNEKADKEERLYEMIAQEENLKKEVLNLRTKLEAEKERLLKWQAEIKLEEEEYKQDLEMLRGKIAEEKRRLRENPYYAKYRELKEKYQNPVAIVEKETCFGCFMSLPFELTKRLKLGKGEGEICPHCKRLLYLPEE